jgi:hypothetical protein
MAARTKRTYALRPETIHRVRELTAGGYATSQDAVVDEAVDRLYRQLKDSEEIEAWTRAAEDPEFQAEVGEVIAAFDAADRWPA